MNMTCGTRTKSLHETKKFLTETTEVHAHAPCDPRPPSLQEPPGRSLAPDAHSSSQKNCLRGYAPPLLAAVPGAREFEEDSWRPEHVTNQTRSHHHHQSANNKLNLAKLTVRGSHVTNSVRNLT